MSVNVELKVKTNTTEIAQIPAEVEKAKKSAQTSIDQLAKEFDRIQRESGQKLKVQMESSRAVFDENTGKMIKSVSTLRDSLNNVYTITQTIKNGSTNVTTTVQENLSKQVKAINDATAAYKRYASAMQSTATASARSIPVTAKNSLLAGMTDSEFYGYNARANMSGYQDAWNAVYAGSGSKINKSTSVFAQIDNAAFARYSSGAINAAQANEALTKSMSQVGKEAATTAVKTETLGHKISKFASWYIIGNTFSAFVRSMREAVQTMKDVDQQLTNIAKVSNKTADEIEAIGDRSYETAKKYAVSVQDYLASVYEFEKAGLGESSEVMAELATKAMLVGDTTQEVANKFLVGVNAAWNLNGSMTALSKVIDQADYVNNNYATTLEKMADGMPIVASTAANMNMSFEETLALLATINSKTQETGRKTATAVRSFLIAVSGQVGEFVDDVGETYEVTTQNVEALTDALKLYGNESVKTAIQTGQVINPMEALDSLAQAYKDGLLDDIKLQEILINVAGKMRYNQLVTIVKDLASETSTYREILGQLPNAAGTADAEVAKMLDSWNAKAQNLKTTWQELIANIGSSETVKTGLDIVTQMLDSINVNVAKNIDVAFGVAGAKVKATKEQLAELRQEYAALSEQTGRTDAEERKLAILQKEIELQEKAVNAARMDELNKKWSERGVEYKKTSKYLEQYNYILKDQQRTEELLLSLGEDQVEQYQAYQAHLKGLADNLETDTQRLLKAYEALSQYSEEELRSMENGEQLVSLLHELDAIFGSTAASTDQAAFSAENYVKSMIDEATQAGMTKQAIYDLVLQQIAFNNQGLDVSQKLAALYQLAMMAGATAQSLILLREAMNGDSRAGQAIVARYGSVENYVKQAMGSVSDNAYVGGRYGIGSTGTQPSGSGGGRGTDPAKAAAQAEKKALEAQKKELQKQRDEEIAAVDAQIAELKAQHKTQEDAKDLAEKQLAVEKAQEELLKAQNERTVRYYNKATDQWEWIADQSKVINAQQKLDDANRALEHEKDQQAYEAQLELLETQKQGLQDYWKEAIASIDAAVEALTDKINGLNTNVTVNVSTNVGGGGSTTTTTSTNTSPQTETPKENAYDRYLKAKEKQLSGGTGSINTPLGNKINTNTLKDKGGVLHGMGAIKATNEDEAVIDPLTWKRLINPEKNSLYGRAESMLRFITSDKSAGISLAGNTDNRIGSQHNGNNYYLGGICLSQAQANQMTVAQLAACAGNLGQYNGRM